MMKVGVTQVATLQVTAIEARALEIREINSCVCEFCSREIGIRQVASGEVEPAQVRAAQLGARSPATVHEALVLCEHGIQLGLRPQRALGAIEVFQHSDRGVETGELWWGRP